MTRWRAARGRCYSAAGFASALALVIAGPEADESTFVSARFHFRF